MVVECWAIVAVLVMMSYMFWSRGMAHVTLTIIPLYLLPIVHLLSGPIARTLNSMDPFAQDMIRSGMDVAAVAISCLLVGILARAIPSSKQRKVYYFLCCGFTIVLSVVLIYDVFVY